MLRFGAKSCWEGHAREVLKIFLSFVLLLTVGVDVLGFPLVGVGKESRVAGHHSDVVIISFWAFKGVPINGYRREQVT